MDIPLNWTSYNWTSPPIEHSHNRAFPLTGHLLLLEPIRLRFSFFLWTPLVRLVRFRHSTLFFGPYNIFQQKFRILVYQPSVSVHPNASTGIDYRNVDLYDQPCPRDIPAGVQAGLVRYENNGHGGDNGGRCPTCHSLIIDYNWGWRHSYIKRTNKRYSNIRKRTFWIQLTYWKTTLLNAWDILRNLNPFSKELFNDWFCSGR